jgi:hypothetical protein
VYLETGSCQERPPPSVQSLNLDWRVWASHPTQSRPLGFDTPQAAPTPPFAVSRGSVCISRSNSAAVCQQHCWWLRILLQSVERATSVRCTAEPPRSIGQVERESSRPGIRGRKAHWGSARPRRGHDEVFSSLVPSHSQLAETSCRPPDSLY